MNRAWSWVAISLIVSIVSTIALFVLYALRVSRYADVALLAVALGSFAVALGAWGKYLLPDEAVVEDRPPEPSPPSEREAAQEAFVGGKDEITRRLVLSSLLATGAGALGLAALLPLRSLGPRPGTALFHTHWRHGARLVRDDGRAIRSDELEVGSVATVFPEGYVGDADAQAMLVRVRPDLLRLSPQRLAWAPLGYVAYSKVCTHVGCPVALYRQSTHELRCPCHQSTFDVLRGAAPVSGPAPRPLPQLPLTVGRDGFLRARGDFPEPIGPSFWTRA
ncbi:MAG: Rieske (2Fe-2S) protein [Candidatus Eremiobacteraeota bacterium]|nr:Rieske (2Fe-2S) protein [Candidatus Eremiobacteraeota bacterium]MBC5827304.1 Rieske (2Fe-2S) protein [Candidatus Eremiobacteraeota bacterium]